MLLHIINVFVCNYQSMEFKRIIFLASASRNELGFLYVKRVLYHIIIISYLLLACVESS